MLWVTSVVMLLLFSFLAGLVWHSRGPIRLDRAGRRLAFAPVESLFGGHYLSGLKGTGVSDAAVWLGSPRCVALLTAVMIVVAARWRDKVGVVLAIIGPAASGLLVEVVFKPIVDRHAGGGLMFPSGHSAGAASVAAVASIIVYRRFHNGGAVRFALVAAGATIAVGFGLVRLGLHFATDVVGGVAVAGSVVLSLAGVLSMLFDAPAPIVTQRGDPHLVGAATPLR